MLINDVAGPSSHCPVDVIFVVDASGSVGDTNFHRMRAFLKDLVSGMDIDSGQTRIGLVSFAAYVQRGASNLNDHSTVSDVHSAIDALHYSRGSTRTDLALAYVREHMLTESAGNRPNVPNIVVVLTDGKSNRPKLTRVCRT